MHGPLLGEDRTLRAHAKSGAVDPKPTAPDFWHRARRVIKTSAADLFFLRLQS
jgi:hypothetical protein